MSTSREELEYDLEEIGCDSKTIKVLCDYMFEIPLGRSRIRSYTKGRLLTDFTVSILESIVGKLIKEIEFSVEIAGEEIAPLPRRNFHKAQPFPASNA